MATAEDVFWLYERNNNINECYEPIINPYTIGNQENPCDLKRKIYIKFGEECPICMEDINTKKTAYLTPCGHSFHKKCIFNAFETKWQTKWASQFYCPICRSRLGQIDIEERYNCRFIEDKYHYMDHLENFWINKDYRYCNPCMKTPKHSEGMDRNCKTCLNYRKTGLSFF